MFTLKKCREKPFGTGFDFYPVNKIIGGNKL